jgi:hypothetical protein
LRFFYPIWPSNMDMRHLFAGILTFALLAGSLAAAETYKFQLPEKVQAGQTELQPGTYSLIVDGSTAVLKDRKGNTIDVKAGVEQEAQKASETSIGMRGDPRKLGSVTLGGTHLRVVFE